PRRAPLERSAPEAKLRVSQRRTNAKAGVSPIALSSVRRDRTAAFRGAALQRSEKRFAGLRPGATSVRRRRGLEVDDAPAECDRNRLSAVADLKLRENISHVHLDRVFGDRKIAGDLFVSLAGGHQRQHLELTRAD